MHICSNGKHKACYLSANLSYSIILVQVFAVQQQMANMKMQQGQPMMMNGGMPLQPQQQPSMPPGQTLNPDLW